MMWNPGSSLPLALVLVAWALVVEFLFVQQYVHTYEPQVKQYFEKRYNITIQYSLGALWIPTLFHDEVVSVWDRAQVHIILWMAQCLFTSIYFGLSLLVIGIPIFVLGLLIAP